MSLLMLILAVPGAEPTVSTALKPADLAAVVLECNGPLYLNRNSKRVGIRSGQGLRGGDVLLVPEESDALLVYRGGRHSRLQGPARTKIAPVKSVKNKSASNWGDRLAGLFADDRAGEFATTVGGVRKPLPLTLLAPRQNGFTPHKFRVAWSILGRPSSFGPADRVVVRVMRNKEALQTRSVDPLAIRRDSGLLEFELPASEHDSPDYRLELELYALDEFGEDVSLGETRRIRFSIASSQLERDLQQELRTLDREFDADAKQECPPRAMLTIARAQTYLAYGFRGEAVAEIVAQLNAEPNNTLWKRILEHYLSDKSARPMSAVSAKQD